MHGKKKPNEFGLVPKYDVDDRVRVWPVFKRPVGTVTAIVDPNAAPIMYMVRYLYTDGRVFEEPYEGSDLTLVERSSAGKCNCSTVTWDHKAWCNVTYKRWSD